MGGIFKLRHINNYSERRTNWDLYSILCDPLPVLALRNLNDYRENGRPHSTLTWLDKSKKKTNNKKRFSQATELTCSCVQLWRGTRGVKFAPLLRRCQKKLPGIVRAFIARTKKLKIQRISDVLPGDNRYPKILLAVAETVDKVAKLKGPDNQMFGSKILHFLIPEFFPVWDNEFIDKKCLSKEFASTSTPKLSQEIKASLTSRAGTDYAAYVNLMLTDLSKIKPRAYSLLEKRFLERVLGPSEYGYVRRLADWHYDDLAPTIYEICLLGKWV